MSVILGGGVLNGTGILFQSGILVPPLVSLDPDAAAYIALIEAAGAAPDAAQKTTISAFYVAAKDTGYYTILKRLYLPIWGVAAANAIDLITGSSGTFNGGVTHGAGFVQGNGTTGYFDMGATPAALNFTSTDYLIGFGNYTATTNNQIPIGAGNSTAQQIYIRRGFSSTNATAFGNSETAHFGTPHTGIYSFGRVGASHIVASRRSSGVTSTGGSTSAGTVPTVNLFGLAHNNNGVAANFSNAQIFTLFASLNLDVTQRDAFTLHLKTLWESCTGLTLP